MGFLDKEVINFILDGDVKRRYQKAIIDMGFLSMTEELRQHIREVIKKAEEKDG